MFISNRESFNNAIIDGEYLFYAAFNSNERVYLERVVTAIVRHYEGSVPYILNLIHMAVNRGFTDQSRYPNATTVAAIIWRLYVEVND